MYDKTDKRRIYQLMDMFLSGRIDAWNFCNEYFYCYDLELDRETLTELEIKAFSELGTVVRKFTNIEEDIKKYPGTFFTEEQLKQKTIETKGRLKGQEPS